MQYLTQTLLITDIKFQLGIRSTVTSPWSDDEIRRSIRRGVQMCAPIGHPCVVTMTKTGYDAASQTISINGAAAAVPTKPVFLHVKQVEVRTSADVPTILTPEVHYQLSNYDLKFISLMGAMASGDTLRIDCIRSVEAPDATSGDDSDTINMDPELLIDYCCSTLLKMQSRFGATSSKADDALTSDQYYARAEARKALLIQQQYGMNTLFTQQESGGGGGNSSGGRRN